MSARLFLITGCLSRLSITSRWYCVSILQDTFARTDSLLLKLSLGVYLAWLRSVLEFSSLTCLSKKSSFVITICQGDFWELVCFGYLVSYIWRQNFLKIYAWLYSMFKQSYSHKWVKIFTPCKISVEQGTPSLPES